jgi:hypothetical protein
MSDLENLEQRVKEDLKLDSPPLSNQEYLDFIKSNFLYYTYDPRIEEIENRSRYYDRRKEISEREYISRIGSGERGFDIQINMSKREEIHTNNAHANLRYRKTPQLDKFREYFRENYPKIFDSYFKSEKVNDNYTTKIVLILENYNNNVNSEYRIVGIEG